MTNDTLIPVIELVRDLAYVGLFAYGINRISAYATKRIDIYGSQGDLFPPRDQSQELEEEEEIILTRGSKDVKGNEKRIGFSLRVEPNEVESEPDEVPEPPKRGRKTR